MSDVIEHLDDPFITLNLIEKNLNPNGILIFTTFNMDAFVPRIMGRKISLDNAYAQILFFK